MPIEKNGMNSKSFKNMHLILRDILKILHNLCNLIVIIMIKYTNA